MLGKWVKRFVKHSKPTVWSCVVGKLPLHQHALTRRFPSNIDTSLKGKHSYTVFTIGLGRLIWNLLLQLRCFLRVVKPLSVFMLTLQSIYGCWHAGNGCLALQKVAAKRRTLLGWRQQLATIPNHSKAVGSIATFICNTLPMMYSLNVSVAVVALHDTQNCPLPHVRLTDILYGFSKQKMHLSGHLVYKIWILFIETWHTVLLAYTSIVFCAVIHFHAL